MKLFRPFLVALLLFIATFQSQAQWKITNNPSGGGYTRTQSFAKIGNNFFAGTLGGGVFISSDNTDTWTAVNSGLTDKNVSILFVLDTKLFAGTTGGTFVSVNNGTNWLPLTLGTNTANLNAYASIGTNMFVGTFTGVYFSNNGGLTWTEVNAGLSNVIVSGLAVIGTKLYASTYGGGVFMSENNGTSWTAVNNGLTVTTIGTIVADGNTLYATGLNAMNYQVYVSNDFGASWNLSVAGFPTTPDLVLAVSKGNVFAGTKEGVYLTSDKGISWKEVNEGFGTSRYIRCLAVLDDMLYTGFFGGDVRRRSLSEMITSVEEDVKVGAGPFMLEDMTPNPIASTSSVRFTIPSRSFVTLVIYDTFGNNVSRLVAEELNGGTYTTNLDASGLYNGIYYSQLQAGGKIQMKKIVVMR